MEDSIIITTKRTTMTTTTKLKRKTKRKRMEILFLHTTIDELSRLLKLELLVPRVESDSMGTIEVPAEHYWGAQTQRSLIHFSIGDDRMPKAVYHAYGYVKKAAAIVNAEAGKLSKDKADLIIRSSRRGNRWEI